jgi:hypothetical protein
MGALEWTGGLKLDPDLFGDRHGFGSRVTYVERSKRSANPDDCGAGATRRRVSTVHHSAHVTCPLQGLIKEEEIIDHQSCFS